MGQEVKNPLRAQSKYGLMGSNAKPGKKFFKGHQSTFCIKMPFGIGHPPTYTSNAVHMCTGGFKGLKSSNGIQFISIHSKVMVFLVISLSPWSPRCPHVVPVIPTSSPHHPHSPQKVPMLSPSSPHHPHVIPIVPTSSP